MKTRRAAGFSVAVAALIALSAGGALAAAPMPAFADTPPTVDCAVVSAELHWGFKESFRSYISGTIARGEWTVADGAAYETPLFSWSDGAGSLAAGDEAVAFTGSITFTGHGGILNTTVANPVVRWDSATRAQLVLDVTGTTQDGAVVDEAAVDFAELDLASATLDAGTPGVLVYSDVPAVLTDAGAAAFGTYEAGELLDPITLRLESAPECIAAVVAPPASDYGWIPWLFVVPALAALTARAVRRRSQRRAKPTDAPAIE